MPRNKHTAAAGSERYAFSNSCLIRNTFCSNASGPGFPSIHSHVPLPAGQHERGCKLAVREAKAFAGGVILAGFGGGLLERLSQSKPRSKSFGFSQRSIR